MWKKSEEEKYRARFKQLEAERELLRQLEETYRMANEKRMSDVSAQTESIEIVMSRQAQLMHFIEQRERAQIQFFETDLPVLDRPDLMPAFRHDCAVGDTCTAPLRKQCVNIGVGTDKTVKVRYRKFPHHRQQQYDFTRCSTPDRIVGRPTSRTETLLSQSMMSRSADSIDVIGLTQTRRLVRSPSPGLQHSSQSLASVPESIDEELEDISKQSRFTVSANDVRHLSPLHPHTATSNIKNDRHSFGCPPTYAHTTLSSRSDVAFVADKGYSSGSNQEVVVHADNNQLHLLKSLSSSPQGEHSPAVISGNDRGRHLSLSQEHINRNKNSAKGGSAVPNKNDTASASRHHEDSEMRSEQENEKPANEKNIIQKLFSRVQRSSPSPKIVTQPESKTYLQKPDPRQANSMVKATPKIVQGLFGRRDKPAVMKQNKSDNNSSRGPVTASTAAKVPRAARLTEDKGKRPVPPKTPVVARQGKKIETPSIREMIKIKRSHSTDDTQGSRIKNSNDIPVEIYLPKGQRPPGNDECLLTTCKSDSGDVAHEEDSSGFKVEVESQQDIACFPDCTALPMTSLASQMQAEATHVGSAVMSYENVMSMQEFSTKQMAWTMDPYNPRRSLDVYDQYPQMVSQWSPPLSWDRSVSVQEMGFTTSELPDPGGYNPYGQGSFEMYSPFTNMPTTPQQHGGTVFCPNLHGGAWNTSPQGLDPLSQHCTRCHGNQFPNTMIGSTEQSMRFVEEYSDDSLNGEDGEKTNQNGAKSNVQNGVESSSLDYNATSEPHQVNKVLQRSCQSERKEGDEVFSDDSLMDGISAGEIHDKTRHNLSKSSQHEHLRRPDLERPLVYLDPQEDKSSNYLPNHNIQTTPSSVQAGTKKSDISLETQPNSVARTEVPVDLIPSFISSGNDQALRSSPKKKQELSATAKLSAKMESGNVSG